MMADVPFGSDGDFSDKEMIYKVNSNLANELGNLIYKKMFLSRIGSGASTVKGSAGI